MLAELQNERAKIVFHLDAVQIARHRNPGDHIGAEENPMMLLHVQELDGKDAGRIAQFGGAEEERRGLLLLFGPPVDNGGEAGQFLDSERTENAEYVEIGMVVAIIAARG